VAHKVQETWSEDFRNPYLQHLETWPMWRSMTERYRQLETFRQPNEHAIWEGDLQSLKMMAVSREQAEPDEWVSKCVPSLDGSHHNCERYHDALSLSNNVLERTRELKEESRSKI